MGPSEYEMTQMKLIHGWTCKSGKVCSRRRKARAKQTNHQRDPAIRTLLRARYRAEITGRVDQLEKELESASGKRTRVHQQRKTRK